MFFVRNTHVAGAISAGCENSGQGEAAHKGTAAAGHVCIGFWTCAHTRNACSLFSPRAQVCAKDEALEAAAVPATPDVPFKWSKPRSILDQDNNGYTL